MACLVSMPALATDKHVISGSCTAEVFTEDNASQQQCIFPSQCFTPNTELRHALLRDLDAHVDRCAM